jgi:hypothetical protein
VINGPGTYTAKVVQHWIDVIPPTDKLVIKIKFQLDDDPTMFFTAALWPTSGDGGARIARKSLSVLGYDCDKQDIVMLDEQKELLAGRPAALVIEVDDYAGDGSLKVAWINAISRPKGKDKYDAINQALRGAKKRKPAPEPVSGDHDKEDGEIPF